MKKIILLSLLSFAMLPAFAQEDEKATNKKKKGIGERFSGLAGKLLTQKADNLSNVAVSTNIISGLFDMRTEATETKYYPAGTREGDYAISVSFLKNQGAGMVELKGEVKCDGVPMESVGLGSYVLVFKEPFTEPKKISIKAENGDAAQFIVKPVPEIEILSVNNERFLPIIDLAEDITVEFTNPPGSENTVINAGLLTDIMGVRAFNYFADFPAKKTKVTIPKEALSNLTVSGPMGAGQLNKGENFFVLERLLKIENSNLGPEQMRGKVPSVTMFARAYSSWRVLVKGKQDEGIITTLNFYGKSADGQIGFQVHKPNAQNGIPFSRGSKFGLISLMLNGSLYYTDSKTTQSSFGYTSYTTTVTTTLQFPELPNEHWDNLLEDFYKKMTLSFKNKFNIPFAAVDKVTKSANYNTLFETEEVNSHTKISRTYMNTKRSSPQKLGEIFKAVGSISSAQSVETPLNKLMQDVEVDGLVSVELNFQVGADKDGHVVLIPAIDFSIRGRDETKNNRNGTYAEGTIHFRSGVPFNSDALRADPKSLIKVCKIDEMIAALEYVLTNLQAKEIAMGYDKIWSIGE